MLIRPARAQGTITQGFVDGTLAVLDPAGERVLMLNATGAAIWALCDGSRTVDEIAAFVQRHASGAPLERVLADTKSMVGRLAECGLLASEPA